MYRGRPALWAFLNLRVIAWRCRLENLRRPTEQAFLTLRPLSFLHRRRFCSWKHLVFCMWKVPSFDERIFHAGRCFNLAVLYFILDHFSSIWIWRKISVILEYQVAQLMIYEFRIRKQIKMLSWLMNLEIINLFKV